MVPTVSVTGGLPVRSSSTDPDLLVEYPLRVVSSSGEVVTGSSETFHLRESRSRVEWFTFTHFALVSFSRPLPTRFVCAGRVMCVGVILSSVSPRPLRRLSSLPRGRNVSRRDVRSETG